MQSGRYANVLQAYVVGAQVIRSAFVHRLAFDFLELSSSADAELKTSFPLSVGGSRFQFDWTSSSPNVTSLTYDGRFDVYDKGGYGIVLTASNQSSVDVLRRGNWVDRSTRVVFIEVAYFNGTGVVVRTADDVGKVSRMTVSSLFVSRRLFM